MVLRRALPLSLCASLAILLTGCGATPNTPHSIPVANSQASGSVHGGQQPVVGATIQLYTVGTTADGSAATPLLTSTVTSDATGSFTITGLYSCTNATQVYIVATGGNPGLSTNNPNIALMAALGPCSSLTSSTFISINELTTVAAVSALAPYMTSASAIGSSPSDASALAAAFTLANQLVNTTTGTAPGVNLPTGYTVPVAQLNTLADVISACINSTGGVAGDGSLCGQLFSLTTISPNPPPTNTIGALLNIVNNPTQNTAALFALAPPTPPFQPTLTSAPPTWQIQLVPPPDNGPVTLTSSANFTILGALQDLTLTNQGNTPLAIASITENDSGGIAAPDFTIAANNCGTTLAAQSSCTITVASSNSPSLLSGQPTTLTGTLTVTDNATSGPQTATLTSTDLYQISFDNEPAFFVTSTGTLSFPPTQVGSTATTPAASSLYYGPIFSTGIAPPIPLTISGADPGDFSFPTPTGGPIATPCLGNYTSAPTIPSGGRCNFSFNFKPTATGTRTAKVSLDPSYATPTGQYILLTGTGVGTGPSFSLDHNSLNLNNYLPGNIDPYSTGGAAIYLTNSGSTTISLAASFTGSAATYLTASVSSCSSVAAKGTCTFTVSFNAPTTGTYSGNLVLSDANSTFTLTVPVTATTSYWRPVANPSILSFGNQTAGTASTAKTFVIADPNGYPIGDPYTVSLQNSSSFTLTQGSTCPASTTQTCTLGIAFAPQTIGAVNEVATITDQTTGLQSQIALSGTGSGPTYTLSTTGIVFTPGTTGSTSTPIAVTLTSSGSQSVSISSVSIPNAVNSNFTQTNNCSSVAAGSSCTINITFAPTASGSQSATLQIASNAVSSPANVALAGSAFTDTSQVLQVSPFSLVFSPTSPTGAVTVTNSSSAPITITSATISGATNATFTITANNCTGILGAGGSCGLTLTGAATSSTGSGSLVITSLTPSSPQSVVLNATSSGGTASTTTATLTPTNSSYSIWGANEDYTLTNTGSGVLVPGSAAAYTSGAAETQDQWINTNTTCSGPLPASGASCTYGLAVLPKLPIADYPSAYEGPGLGTLYVNDSVGQQTVPLISDDGAFLWAPAQTSGFFTGGVLPGVLTLPSTQVGSSQTATVVLAGVVSGSPSATLTIAGANPGDFTASAVSPSVSPNPSSSCPVGTAPCTITVTFTPTALGTRSAKISLDPPNPYSYQQGQYLYVTGTAVGSGPSFSIAGGASLTSYLPANLDPYSIGKQTLTVTNTGNTTISLAASLFGANPANFTVDASQCQSIASHTTCSVNLTFSSSAVGAYNAILFLNDTASTASATVPLSGATSYWKPTLTAYTGFIEFPTQKVNTISAPLTFTVTDPNGYPIGDPISISVTSDLILPQGGYCPTGAQPCTFVVQFDPLKSGSPLYDTLSVTDTVTGAGITYVFYGSTTQ